MSHERNPVDARRYLPGPRASVAAAAVVIFVATSLSVLAPRLDLSFPRTGAMVRAAFSRICHQIPSRSIGGPLDPHALCARCEGLYSGGTVALIFAALVAPRRIRFANRWLVLFLVPSAADILVRAAGGAGLESFARFLVAIPAGFAAGVLLAVGVADWSLILARSCADGRPGPPSRARALAENPHG